MKFYWYKSRSYFGNLINSNVYIFSSIGQQEYLIPRHVRILHFFSRKPVLSHFEILYIMLMSYTKSAYEMQNEIRILFLVNPMSNFSSDRDKYRCQK